MFTPLIIVVILVILKVWLKPSKKIRPDVIVNAAAHTAVDKAESEPEFAQLLNATSVESIAKAANEVGALGNSLLN